MSNIKIRPSLFKFLNELKVNNNREWFGEHKPRFQEEYNHFKEFANAVLDGMSETDNIEKLKVYRIYRDVRFSKNKTPYKNSVSGNMARATKWLRGGYYFHLEPNNSFIAGGFWAPNSADLKRIRTEIAVDADPLRKIIANSVFQKTFGELQGDEVKTAPRGFAKDHPNLDLLRKKQYLVSRKFTDKEVFAANFLQQTIETFQNMRPFFDYMSDVLTTDANGVPIED